MTGSGCIVALAPTTTRQIVIEEAHTAVVPRAGPQRTRRGEKSG